MTRTDPRNVAASVQARLLNLSKKSGDDYNVVLTAYAAERFLFRLGASPLRDRFILKGAMLLRVWSDHPYRSTRDLDLARRGDGSVEAIRNDIETICETVVEPDGLVFEAASMKVEPIRLDDDHGGTRVRMDVICGNARIPMQIDVGVGDALDPKPVLSPYNTLLPMPKPRIVAYRQETVIAEKLEAIVVLGERNSRIKDFFDIWYLARTFDFDRAPLTKAIAGTFNRRNTPMPPDEPIGLTAEYWENPLREPQIRAFVRRSRLVAAPERGIELLDMIRPFLLPIVDDVRRGLTTKGHWPAGGPWS